MYDPTADDRSIVDFLESLLVINLPKKIRQKRNQKKSFQLTRFTGLEIVLRYLWCLKNKKHGQLHGRVDKSNGI